MKLQTLDCLLVKKWGKYTLISFLLLWLSSAYASPGIDWLATQAKQDGSYAGTADIALPFQSTAEVLKTFHLEGVTQQQPGVAAALQFLNSETYHNTENLARKIIVFSASGQDTSELVAELVQKQNVDGGFGEHFGYHSSVLDTALALQAFYAAAFSNDVVLSKAINYLERQQDRSGGFNLGVPNVNSIVITSEVSIALQPYVFTYSTGSVVNKATEYLYSEQLATGGWNSVWETAQALLAVIPVTSDSTRYINALNVIKNAQRLNGSWNDDVFISALAERALFLASGAALPSDPTAGSIKGKLVDQNGLAFPGVIMNAVGINGTYNATTNVDGSFVFPNITPDNYNVSVSLAGFMPVSQTVNLQAGNVTDLGTIQLVPLDDQGVLQGIVVDSNTGLPIVGASVSISGSTTAALITDVTGRYITAVTPGDITVNVTASGYSPASGSATISAGQILLFSPAMIPVTSPNPITTVSLTGTIMDSVSGLPVAGVDILLGGVANGQTVTDDGGRFIFTAISAGNTTIQIAKPGYQTGSLSLLTTAGSVMDLGPILIKPTSPPATSTINGIVTDEVSGLPISNVTVKIDGTTLTAVTDNTGSYSINGIQPLQFSILAQSPGYISTYQSVTLSTQGTSNVNLTMRQATVNGIGIDGLWTEKVSYNAYETVNVTSVIRNSGDTARSVKLLLEVIDSSSQHVQTLFIEQGGSLAAPAESFNLLPGATLDISAKWLTHHYTPGNYQIRFKVFDQFTDALVAERVTAINVQATEVVESASLKVTPAFSQVGASEQLDMSLTTSNKSNVITQFNVDYSLVSPSGVTVASGSKVVVLDPAKSSQKTNLINQPVMFSESGVYNATFTVTSGTTPMQQTNAVISVAPSLRVEASQNISPAQVVPDGDKRIRIQIQLKGVEAQ